jgi:hypothetical protein
MRTELHGRTVHALLSHMCETCDVDDIATNDDVRDFRQHAQLLLKSFEKCFSESEQR